MKILQITYNLSSGGAERFCVDLCNRLVENPQNEVILVTICDDRISRYYHYLPDLSSSVRYINLRCSSGLDRMAFIRLYRVIKAENPDIVHSHVDCCLLFLPSLLLKNIKYVHTQHSLAHKNIRFKKLKYIYRWFYRNKIKTVTISGECRKSCERFLDIDPICIPNGRESLQITKEYEVVREYIDTSKVLSDALVFLMVARVAEAKNQQRLFKTFEKLQQEGVHFLLICVGAGYDDAGYTDKYKNNPQIMIVGECRNVGDYMACVDYFVLSSDWEGLPLSLLEAMSMGVVPICTPAGGIVDVIKDGVNGYLAESISDDAFYEKVKYVITHKGAKINKKLLKKEYESNYSMKTCAERYYKIYKF